MLRSFPSTGWAATTWLPTGSRISAGSISSRPASNTPTPSPPSRRPTRNEIRGPVGGMGLAPYLNNRAEHRLRHLNGVDTTLWNPATDNYLPARYSRDNLAGKAACKKALAGTLRADGRSQNSALRHHFPIRPAKGFRPAARRAAAGLARHGHASGGSRHGRSVHRKLLPLAERGLSGRANAHIGFVPELAHLIEAGSDFFLMPSLYEPCGLNQMYSSLYGTLPIVRATGGLDDTVENYDEAAGRGTGFKFWEISGRALYYTIGWAVSTWYDRPQHVRGDAAAGHGQGLYLGILGTPVRARLRARPGPSRRSLTCSRPLGEPPNRRRRPVRLHLPVHRRPDASNRRRNET
jgi:hypothetical protein